MTRELIFEQPPELRRLYASALLRRGARRTELTDVRVVRPAVAIDPAVVLDYARLCRFTVGSAVPVTFPHLIAFPLQVAVMGQPDFPLPLVGAVHVANVITSLRPIGMHEVLDVAVHAEQLRPHRRGRQVDVVSELTSGGALVWREISTYLSRDGDHPDAPSSHAPGLGDVPATPHARWQVPTTVGRSYAALSGDWNPIHLHSLGARLLGYPTVIAHGMYTYARVMAALGSRLPGAGLTSRVWFRKPLPLGSTVQMRSLVAKRITLSVVEQAGGAIQHAAVENTW